MKMKEIFINRYGPLVYNTALRLKDFNLFYGKNEDGKTLTIDAIVKLFFGHQAREFNKINRVDEIPEGYLIIEDSNGRDIKIPEKGDLINYVDLFPVDYKNIFIIRNSDLSISREGQFYTGIADRLTGLRMDKIQRVREVLLERAKITPGGTFRDIKGEKLKTRLETAERLIEKAESLTKRINGENFDTWEEVLVEQRERIEVLESDINNMEDARKRENYEKGILAIDALEESRKRLDELNEYSEADESFWSEKQRDIDRLIIEKEQLLGELQLKEKSFDAVEEELDGEEREFDLLNEKKRYIDEEVKPLLKSYEQKKSEQEGERSKKGFFTILFIFFLVCTAVSLYGVIVKPVLLMFFPFFVFTLSALIMAFLKYKYLLSTGWLSRTFSMINSSLLKLGLNADTSRGIWLNIQKFDDTYKSKLTQMDSLRLRRGILEREIKDHRTEKIPEYDVKISSTQRDLKEIKEKTGEQDLQEYRKKVIEKREHSALIEQQENILKSLLGNTLSLDGNNLLFWKKEVAELERYRDKAKDLEYKEKELEKLKIDRERCRVRVAEIDEKMGSIQNNLLDIEREANKILQPEGDYLHCKTSLDLNTIKKEISNFIQSCVEMKDHTLEVLDLLEAVELEKRERISELFGKDSAVSVYFSNITNGRYVEVSLNQETMAIEVFRNDNKILNAERLSAGTFDQLYLAIRIALGEKILKQERGFFIMDDPFIRSDTERLDKQIETLKKMTGWGWQILYFSAKEEIRQRLEKDIQREKIAFFELPGTLFLY